MFCGPELVEPQAGSAKFDPKARAAAVSAAGDEVPAACGGPSTPGGGPSALHGTTKLPHCIEVRVGGVWRGAAPVVGIVANVAEVGGQRGVAVCRRRGLEGPSFTRGTGAVVVVSTSIVSIATTLFVALVAGGISRLLNYISLRVVHRVTWVAGILATLVMLRSPGRAGVA